MFSLYSWSVLSRMWINDWVPQLLKNPLFPHRTNLAWYSEWERSLCKEPLQLQNLPRLYFSWRYRDKLSQGHQTQLQGSASHMTTGYCICMAEQNAVLWLWSGSEGLNSDKSQSRILCEKEISHCHSHEAPLGSQVILCLLSCELCCCILENVIWEPLVIT